MNPVRGGRPPSDSRTRGVREVSTGVLAHEMARVLMFVEVFSLKIKNVVVVKIRYVANVSSVRDGENWMINSIHPRWAIEE